MSIDDTILNDTEIIDEEDVKEEDYFRDSEYEDNISDTELLADILKDKPRENKQFDNIIVVDGMPKIERYDRADKKSRFDKLHTIIRKIYDTFGEIICEKWPVDEDGMTKGYAFFEYRRAEYSLEAVNRTQNYRLDKTHTLVCNLFTDFDKYSSLPKEWNPPDPQPYPDYGNLRSYLLDENVFDQYCLAFDDKKVSIYSNSLPKPTLLQQRLNWTEKLVAWSPYGTYLATLHTKGVAFWGSDQFRQIIRFTHPGVESISFSPCEKYLITYSFMHHSVDPVMSHRYSTSAAAPMSQMSGLGCMKVWEIATGTLRRSFALDRHSCLLFMQSAQSTTAHAQSTGANSSTYGARLPNLVKWSHDDRYFARLQRVQRKDGSHADVISVFETPGCGLLDKRSLEVPGVHDFCWSPTEHVLCYWVREVNFGEVPARVTLIAIPSRDILRSKNLFSVTDVKLCWHSAGYYLCAKVDRYSRAKKEKEEVKYVGVHYNLEIFHLRHKGVPVDSVEIKQKVVTFAWEPCGSRLAVITTPMSGKTVGNNSVLFYKVKEGGGIVLIKSLEKRSHNYLFWSPRGQHIVLATLFTNYNNGSLSFVHLPPAAGAISATTGLAASSTSIAPSSSLAQTAPSTAAAGEQQLLIAADTDALHLTQVEWDTTGRYLLTSDSSWRDRHDYSTYWLWTCHGAAVYQQSVSNCAPFHIMWRPRPPCYLSEKQLKNIRKNLAVKYSPNFNLLDRMRASNVIKELVEKRQRLDVEFHNYKQERHQLFGRILAQRKLLRDEEQIDEVASEEEVVESIVKTEVIPVE